MTAKNLLQMTPEELSRFLAAEGVVGQGSDFVMNVLDPQVTTPGFTDVRLVAGVVDEVRDKLLSAAAERWCEVRPEDRRSEVMAPVLVFLEGYDIFCGASRGIASWARPILEEVVREVPALRNRLHEIMWEAAGPDVTLAPCDNDLLFRGELLSPGQALEAGVIIGAFDFCWQALLRKLLKLGKPRGAADAAVSEWSECGGAMYRCFLHEAMRTSSD